jgi:hypothetical protein
VGHVVWECGLYFGFNKTNVRWQSEGHVHQPRRQVGGRADGNVQGRPVPRGHSFRRGRIYRGPWLSSDVFFLHSRTKNNKQETEG